MDLSTFTGLKAAVEEYLVDDDISAPVETFIALAEKRFLRDLRVRQLESKGSVTLIAGTEEVALPTGFLEARAVVLQSSPVRVLPFKTPTQFFEDHGSSSAGTPAAYTIIGSNFHFGPVPGSALTADVVFYAAPTALSATNASNAILEDAPDIYLYGALLEAMPYLGDDDRALVWVQLYDRAVDAMKKVDARTAWSSGPLVMRVENYTP